MKEKKEKKGNNVIYFRGRGRDRWVISIQPLLLPIFSPLKILKPNTPPTQNFSYLLSPIFYNFYFQSNQMLVLRFFFSLQIGVMFLWKFIIFILPFSSHFLSNFERLKNSGSKKKQLISPFSFPKNYSNQTPLPPKNLLDSLPYFLSSLFSF